MSDTYAPAYDRTASVATPADDQNAIYPSLGFLIIVLVPAAFWTLLYVGVSSLTGAPAGWSAIATAAGSISLFLSLVWAVMQRGRTGA